jgi:hypothetical protein
MILMSFLVFGMKHSEVAFCAKKAEPRREKHCSAQIGSAEKTK